MKYTPGDIPEGINVTDTHPLKELSVLLFGILGALIVLFFALGWAAGVLATKLPVSYEKKLGEFFSGRFTHEQKDEATIKATEYVQGVLDSLVAFLPDEDKRLPYTVSIQCTEQINAFAVPGGKIVILSGLLKKMDSEQELALLLGHELGHHVHRDHLRGLGRALVVMLGLVTIGISDQSGLAGSLLGESADVVLLKYSREAESQADRLGLDLVKKNYENPAPAVELFLTFDKETKGILRKMPSWSSTHPNPRARYEILKAEVGEIQEATRKPLPEGIFANICPKPKKDDAADKK